MKIIFFTPPLPPLFQRHVRERYMPYPLGIAYLGAVLKKNGYDVELVYSGALRFDSSKLLAFIDEKKPDIIGFSVLSPHLARAVSFASMVKKKYPKIITVIGNVHATALPVETLEAYPAFDFLISGEAEISFLRFLKALSASDGDFSSIPGLAYRCESNVLYNGAGQGVQNLDELPFPGWHLFKAKGELSLRSKFMNPLWLTVQASRGCPFQCIFCQFAEDKAVRYRSAESVSEEIWDWDVPRFHAKYLTFTDSSFSLNRERTLRLLEAMIKKGIGKKIKWECLTRVDCVDKEILSLMKKAGCDMIIYGTESGSQKILNHVRKAAILDDAKKAIELTHKAGIKTTVSMIFGHPHETHETIEETIQYTMKLNPTMAAFTVMIHFPGTEVENMAREGKGNYVKVSDKDDYSRWSSGSYELKDLPGHVLEAYQRKGFLKFYFRPSRILVFLRNQDATGIILFFYNTLRSILTRNHGLKGRLKNNYEVKNSP